MARVAALIGAGILASSLLGASEYYALELRGGSRVYSADRPAPRGRTLVFHRYPDGVFVSMPAGEVEKVVALEKPPAPEGNPQALAPGQTLYVGPPVEGPNRPSPPAAPAPEVESSGWAPGYDYGYADYGWGWGGGYVPGPRPPAPAPPSRIGPNGFPILAPPGSPGSVPPPIGPNGFPILAPQPPVASPRPH